MPFALLALAALAATPPASEPASLPRMETADLNPNAMGLLERDPVLMAWAVKQYDANGDGWLTSFEAQPALAGFKAMADTDHDCRVTVNEYAAARAFVAARYGLSTEVGERAAR